MDIYLFAFLSGLTAVQPEELQKSMQTGEAHHLVHLMPDAWNRPHEWNPLGTLVLKSEAEEKITVEIGGQDAGREMRSLQVEVPPRTRVQVRQPFFSLSYVHTKSPLRARIGLHSPQLKETHIVGPADWENVWVYGLDILLAGYLTRGE